MARFFVGQRVRIVGVSRPECANGTRLIGREATITGRSKFHDWKISIDGIGRIGAYGGEFAFYEHQLEPITNIDQSPAELTAEELLPFLKTREVA